MERQPKKLWQKALVGLWFAVVVGMMARLGEDFRLLAALRQEKQQLQEENRRLNHRLIVLQNKLRFLSTPEGVRMVKKMQLMVGNGEKIFVLEEGFFMIGVMDLLPGGFEEWQEKKFQHPKTNRWLVRLFRFQQRLRSEGYR